MDFFPVFRMMYFHESLANMRCISSKRYHSLLYKLQNLKEECSLKKEESSLAKKSKKKKEC